MLKAILSFCRAYLLLPRHVYQISSPTAHMELPTMAKTANYNQSRPKMDSQRMSVDAKVVNGIVSCCVLIGLALVVAGGVVYSQLREGTHDCSCHGDICCETLKSLCSECWCHEPDEQEAGYCGGYDKGGSVDAAISIAIAGLIVCIISATMLVTMHWCKEWSEKHLHVRYPPVIPMDYQEETL